MLFSDRYNIAEVQYRIDDLVTRLDIEYDAMVSISKFYTEVFGDFAYIFPENFETYFLNVITERLTATEIDVLIMRFVADCTVSELNYVIGNNEEETERELLRIERKCRANIGYNFFIKLLLISEETDGNFEFRPYNLEDLIMIDDEKEAERKIRFNILFTLEELDLSVRAYNCLKRAGYDEDRDFENKTIDDLRAVRNMNTKSLNEIVEKLEEYNIYL